MVLALAGDSTITKFFLIFELVFFFVVVFLAVDFLAATFLVVLAFVVAVTIRLANFLSDYSTYHNDFFSTCQEINQKGVLLIGKTPYFEDKKSGF